jgi:mannose-6-phosphate isomerase-like protein (cupin superfamily)
MKLNRHKFVDKKWGYEEWICNNSLYCGKKLFVKKGKSCSLHRHKNKDETFWLLSGKIMLEIGNCKIPLEPEDSIRVRPNTLHRFTGLEDSILVEFSTHHEDSDSYRVSQDNENLISYKEASDAILMAVGHSKTLKSLA